MGKKSFSVTLKNELAKIKPTGCCRMAECYGLLLFSRSFCENDISIRTKSAATAEKYKSLLSLCFSAHTVTEQIEDGYIVSVSGDANRKRIVNFYSSGESDWIFNPKFVKKSCCRWAFIRGAFLACGSINNPEKYYHLEFAVRDSILSFAFSAFLELCGYKPKTSVRTSVTALYYNSSTVVEEILGLMGATQLSLELMEIKIMKDMRNRLNRQNNFETANIGKTVNAAVEQNDAIKFLTQNNLLEMLPEELYEVAVLRKNNPDASLSRLCQLSKNTISRSGINHRLQRIVAFAEDTRNKKE